MNRDYNDDDNVNKNDAVWTTLNNLYDVDDNDDDDSNDYDNDSDSDTVWIRLNNLYDKVATPEVGDGARQSSAAPDKAQEQRALGVGELLHHLPEPLNQCRWRIDALVRGHRLE